MPGLLLLFITALIALVALVTIILIWEARRPRRRTTAYAIARGWPSDPGEDDLAYEEWTLDRPDGARISVWDIDLKTPGHTAILIHGWGQSRIDMLQRIDPWRPHCGRILMYDLRGHGESLGLSRLGHAEDDDLLDLIARLAQPVILVGYSMGGVIALHAAARHANGHVRGVVTYGPYTDFHRSLRGRLVQAGLPTRPVSDLAMMWFRFRGIRHRDLHADLGHISCPVLVLHGEDDAVSPLDHGRTIAQRVRDGELIVIPEAGHTDLLQVAPDEVGRAIDEFAKRISEPHA